MKQYCLFKSFVLSFFLLFFSVSVFAEPAVPNVVLLWDSAALDAIRVYHVGPPQAARANAIVHTAMYDAWTAYDPVALGTRLGAKLRRPAGEMTLANKQKAMSYAAYHAMMDLYPPGKEKYDDMMYGLGYNPNDTTTDTTNPAGVGNVAASALLEYRHHDGSNQLGDLHPGPYSDYTGYTPVNDPDHIIDPNRWQPLRVSDGAGGFILQNFIAPFWGKVTPFALTSGSQFRPTSMKIYPSNDFTKQVQEVLNYSANLTDRQKVIAEYWADGPHSELPPGHWCLFGQDVSKRDGHDLDDDAKMFFALTNAIFDASIVAWDAKRYYDSVRPISAIQYLFNGRMIKAWAGPYEGTRLIRAEDWKPYQPVTVVTPPFSEYVSGHSAFSAAGAEILRLFTGSDYFGGSAVQLAGTSRVEPGMVPARDLTLRWATFTKAANEAGVSRRYGGIHFLEGDMAGRKTGRQVGAQAWKKALKYFNGSPIKQNAEHRHDEDKHDEDDDDDASARN